MSLMRSVRPVVAVLLSLSQFFPGVSSGRAIGLPSNDTTPPEVSHTPLTEYPAGMPLRIQAMVTDNAGVSDVVLIYRSTGDNEYRRVPMLEAPGSGIYSVDLPDAVGPRIEYFIQATDEDGNTTPDRMLEPYVITVTEMKADIAAAPTDVTAPLLVREQEGVSKWVWIGLGVVAVAALAGGGSSGSGDAGSSGNSGNSGGSGTVTITAPLP